MNFINKDKEYSNIVSGIFNNIEVLNLDTCIHHGISRLDHSFRVSYYSYKITKALKLDSKKTAVAGLLHDFFFAKNMKKSERFRSAFVHPKIASANAQSYFELSDMEKDIIESHMFPLIPNKPPKYLEGWIVSIVDKCVATYEFSYSFSRKFKFRLENAMILAVLFINNL